MSSRTVYHDGPSNWLRERLIEIETKIESIPSPQRHNVVLVTLDDPLGRSDLPGEIADRTCDKCGDYVEPEPANGRPAKDAPYMVGTYTTTSPWKGKLMVVFGLCRECSDQEQYPENGEGPAVAKWMRAGYVAMIDADQIEEVD